MFRTQSLNRGYTDRGLYGYQDARITQGPGQYTPYANINTPTHRMADPKYYPDRERSRDILHARDMEPYFLSLTTLERNQPLLRQGRPKKPEKAIELCPRERLIEDRIFLTLPRSTWCRHPIREEEVTKRPQEERERYVREHARSTPALLGMLDVGHQTQTKLADTVLGSNANLDGTKFASQSFSKRTYGGNVNTESVNTRERRKDWGSGYGNDQAEKSLLWYRNRQEHSKRYVLESTRENHMANLVHQHSST